MSIKFDNNDINTVKIDGTVVPVVAFDGNLVWMSHDLSHYKKHSRDNNSGYYNDGSVETHPGLVYVTIYTHIANTNGTNNKGNYYYHLNFGPGIAHGTYPSSNAFPTGSRKYFTKNYHNIEFVVHMIYNQDSSGTDELGFNVSCQLVGHYTDGATDLSDLLFLKNFKSNIDGDSYEGTVKNIYHGLKCAINFDTYNLYVTGFQDASNNDYDEGAINKNLFPSDGYVVVNVDGQLRNYCRITSIDMTSAILNPTRGDVWVKSVGSSQDYGSVGTYYGIDMYSIQ